MTDLITRLSKLEGPDREVDREIAKLFNMPWDYSAEWIKKRDEEGNRFDVPVAFPYTSSVDAAIALAERVLPGCDLTIRSKHKMAWIDGLKGEIAYGANPAIAACIAILRAKEASHGE